MAERTGTSGGTANSADSDTTTESTTETATDATRDDTTETATTTGRPAEIAPDTEPELVDAEEDEAPPAERRSRGNWAKWRARLIVLLLIAAADWAAKQLIRTQDARDAALDLGTVTLTATPIPVETSITGVITAVQVHPGDRVARGQHVGRIDVTTTNSEGEPVVKPTALIAPRPGIVADDPVTVGSTLTPGVPFVHLYDPTELRFEAEVPLTYLPQLSPGMTAELKTEGLDETVDAVVQRAVPRLEGDQDKKLVAADEITLILVPRSARDVARMVPGLQFTGDVDTRTGNPDEHRSIYVG
jgi:hypothetical protein